ncbi:hypothetical protein [Rubripirellula obstinata]|uniref:hypothetical protein n=1 Tax=Rubripirellula obstinata TaxID=406547 RepID=UPI0008317382|nr:hypothetical protein [Rubripirellula obstinata]
MTASQRFFDRAEFSENGQNDEGEKRWCAVFFWLYHPRTIVLPLHRFAQKLIANPATLHERQALCWLFSQTKIHRKP